MATMTLTSHPSRVRGLKSFYKHHRGLQKMVAPFTGAWIEIIQRLICSSPPSASHPSRVRGLKLLEEPQDTITKLRRTLHGCVD